MKFTPHETYEGLRVQANALATLVSTKEFHIACLTARVAELERAKRHVSQDELESEREMNALLTEENDILRRGSKKLAEWIVERCGPGACEMADQVLARMADRTTVRR